MLAILVVGVGLVVYVLVAFNRSAERIENREQATASTQQLETVAPALDALCSTDPTVRARVGRPACETAAQATTATPTPGRDGTNGVGITKTEVRDGRLIISYTDGRVEDLGVVVGPGGNAGTSGVGIVSSQLVQGRLVLTFTDGRAVDVGAVVGDPGRGIQSTDVVDGRLIVTYTDGSMEDAGALPQGPAGQAAPPAAELTLNQPDGSALRCPRSGGDDSTPVYTCQEAP